MLKIQILVATMNQDDYSLPEKMNIRTEAIVGNQCDRNSVEEFQYMGNKIKYLNFSETGVGLNRNNALMRADADIVLFADDDMVYLDDYKDKIENAFSNNPQADVVLFNLKEKIPTRKIIEKPHNVGYLNYLRYGTARMAIRLSSVKKNGILFNLCFGGGTEYSHGEDNLFLNNCLKKGLKIIAVPEYIAELVDDRKSTWNNGYDYKYLTDQGVLYRALSRNYWKILCLQDAIRRHKSYNKGWVEAYRIMKKGANKF